MRATVSKDGDRHRACGHPSRRSRDEVARAPQDDGWCLFRLRLIPSDLPPQGPLARPFFILRERRAKTSANYARTPARRFALRFGNRRVSLDRGGEPSGETGRPCRAHEPGWLSAHHHQGHHLSSTSACLVLHDRQVVPRRCRPPRLRSFKQSLGQSASCNTIAELRQQMPSKEQCLRFQGRASPPVATMARHCLEKRPEIRSWDIRNRRGSPRHLRGGGPQAVRRICPGGVAPVHRCDKDPFAGSKVGGPPQTARVRRARKRVQR